MSKQGRNVLIVGAGVAGKLLARDIELNTDHQVVGFLDDKKHRGLNIVGSVDELPAILKTHQIDEVIIAVPSGDGSMVRRLLLKADRSVVPIRVVPRESWVISKNDVTYSAVRPLVAEDWLGRSLRKGSIKRLAKYYTAQVVLVTGGAGSIGSEIVRQLLEAGAKQVVIFDNSEYQCWQLEQEFAAKHISRQRFRVVLGDVTVKDRVVQVMRRYRPGLVLHAAAYKHVDLIERNIDEGLRVNILGTRNVVDAAISQSVSQFLLISTDKAVNPTSVMGLTKRLAEEYVRRCPRSTTYCNIVRFGNVINSRGSVLPFFEKQIRERRKVIVTDPKMQRYFMSGREAAHLVLTSATRKSRGAVYVLDMGDLISLDEIVTCLIRSRDLRPGRDVEIQVMGRRPGEKLREELFTKDERKRMRQTSLEYIYRIGAINRTDDGVDDIIDQIIDRFDGQSKQELSRDKLEPWRQLFV